MKLLAHTLRVITGLLFLFSGFIKLNDPEGFKLKLEEYLTVFQHDLSDAQDTLKVNIKNPDSLMNVNYSRTLKNESNKTFSFYTAPWVHDEVRTNDGQIQSQYDHTTFYILLDGEELFKQVIKKYTVAPKRFQIDVTVGKDIILNKTITIYNNVDVKTEDIINVSLYKRTPGFFARLLNTAYPHALILSILICVSEVVLGISLLIGWKRNLILWLIALMILFFTFLTGYSAIYNKVTDCGCFGNAIPLTPWQSFVKDLVLCLFIGILILLRKYIIPVFSPKFSSGTITVFAVAGTVFSIYCWFFLPVFNFLKFKEGNNIEAMMQLPPNAKAEVREFIFVYTKDGKDYEFTAEELSEKKINENPQYTFKTRLDKVITEGDKPEIHDFAMIDAEGNNHLDEFFKTNDYKLLLVSEDLTKTRPRIMKKVAVLAKDWTTKSGLEFWALTSNSSVEAEAIRHEFQFEFKFYFGDHTTLKSIVRSNPGLLLFKKGVIIKIWPSTDLPSYKELKKIIK